MTDTIEITVTGEARAVAPGTTVGRLLDELAAPRERVAVELNRRVVRRAEWTAVELADGDRLEIVHFVGGG
jgi:thiamine biosynthesis protein ThiS